MLHSLTRRSHQKFIDNLKRKKNTAKSASRNNLRYRQSGIFVHMREINANTLLTLGDQGLNQGENLIQHCLCTVTVTVTVSNISLSLSDFQGVPVHQVLVSSSSYCLRKHSPTGKKSQILCWYIPWT